MYQIDEGKKAVMERMRIREDLERLLELSQAIPDAWEQHEQAQADARRLKGELAERVEELAFRLLDEPLPGVSEAARSGVWDPTAGQPRKASEPGAKMLAPERETRQTEALRRACAGDERHRALGLSMQMAAASLLRTGRGLKSLEMEWSFLRERLATRRAALGFLSGPETTDGLLLREERR